MPSDTETAALKAEFDALTARAGISHPAERLPHMFESFVALRGVLADLHKPYAYSDEPALISRLQQKGA